MGRKCVMCHAAQPEFDQEIKQKEDRITELEAAIEEAKKANTKEEADNIFDSIF